MICHDARSSSLVAKFCGLGVESQGCEGSKMDIHAHVSDDFLLDKLSESQT